MPPAFLIRLATKLFGLTFAALALVGCTPIMLVNALVNRSNFTLRSDLAYGPDPRQRLDVYTPKNVAKAPVLIFVHGGSWYGGDKADYPFLADAFVGHGFVTVTILYRVAPQAQFPAFVQDAALAVRWVRDNIATLGGDPDRLYLMGQSAGAQIAALVALDPTYLREVGLERSALRAFVGQAGPYDFRAFLEGDEPTQKAMGPREGWPRTQPINFVDGAQPPMLLQHGSTDTVVNPNNPEWLSDLIKAKGGQVEVRLYPNVDHPGIVGALSRIGQLIEPRVLRDILDFLAKH
jgi:acetyl esterase/lipase